MGIAIHKDYLHNYLKLGLERRYSTYESGIITFRIGDKKIPLVITDSMNEIIKLSVKGNIFHTHTFDNIIKFDYEESLDILNQSIENRERLIYELISEKIYDSLPNILQKHSGLIKNVYINVSRLFNTKSFNTIYSITIIIKSFGNEHLDELIKGRKEYQTYKEWLYKKNLKAW